MGHLKIILHCTVLALAIMLSACNPSSRSVEKKPVIKKTDANRTCIPESELLSANIMGGQVVQQSDVDAKVAMMLVSDGQLCTAVAIGKKILLTAAHCIAGNKTNTYVSFYSSVSCESGYNKNLHIKGVSETIVHEDFDPAAKADEMVGDIALVILEEDIPPGYVIYKIANPDEIDETSDMYLYGYGRTGSNSEGVGILRKTKMDRSVYNIDIINKKIKLNQMSGAGICKGDSGGPAFVNIAGQMYVIGINSYVVGPENDICSKYSYQTLAHSYKEWIDYKLSIYTK